MNPTTRAVELLAQLTRSFREWKQRNLPPPLTRHVLGALAIVTATVLTGAVLWTHPPFQSVAPGEVGVRTNALAGGLMLAPPGPVVVLPLVHALRVYSLRDQVYRPDRADSAPYQTVEGLDLKLDVIVRYALDPERLEHIARRLPTDVAKELVEPMADGVLHRVISQHRVKEIFSEARAAIQVEVEGQLRALLAPDGVIVRSVLFGHVALPEGYRQELETLLSQQVAADRIVESLKVKEKQIEEKRLDGEIEKTRRAQAAEALALEEVIAAKGRAEAMKHVLPLKEREIEQKRLESEAMKVQRELAAEADASARRIDSTSEAEARRRLAEADAYRIEVTGKAKTDQFAREAAIIGQNPLLVQKAFAEKLSERLQVVIAPPAASGFFAQHLLPPMPPAIAPAPVPPAPEPIASAEVDE